MRRICVFCGSRPGGRPEYAAAARTLGGLLAREGLGLVYGGGHIGLMGTIADATLAAGGEVIGVIPQSLVDKELAHLNLSELKIVASMHARKAEMERLSDGFIALPGAFGTADELFEILTWAQLGLHRKPVGLLNVEGFFDALLQWLERAEGDGFLKPTHRRLLLQADSAEELLTQMKSYHPPQVTAKWIVEGET
jgi:uncharacterized protein (TIGR00730 family)